jgi:arylformamidase
MADAVYRDLTLEQVEQEYQPAVHVESLQAVIDDYHERGVAARESLHHQRHQYGGHPDEWLWYVAAPSSRAPLVVFLHGGDWRHLSADDGSLLAPGAHLAGCAFASANYSLCPHEPLEVLVQQARRAVAHLVEDARRYGHDPRRVIVVGHSSGAHLAAMVAVHDPRPAAFVLVSGIFDLTPIVYTPINDDVRLTAGDAARLSPQSLISYSPADCVVAWSMGDTDECRRQALEWAKRWSDSPGNRRATAVVEPNRHHFDVIDDLFDPNTHLGTALRDILDA